MYPFNLQAFVALFPEFAAEAYASMLPGWWTQATNYVTNADSNYGLLVGVDVVFALNLMTAHIAKSFKLINAGQAQVVLRGASEGPVNIQMEPPPAKTMWQWWLATTPYGQQLLAFLDVQSAGGFYIGGSCERQGFRKAGGRF